MSSKQRELERDLRRRYRLWTPMFTVVVLATLASFMMGQGANAGTSVFLVRVGGTATYVGFLAVVFSVAAAAARFVAGPLVDRRGRRVVAVGGAALMVLGTLGPLLSEELVPFVLWRFLQGAGFSAATTALATAAADVLPQERLGEGIGYYGLGQAVSMSFGPALALMLASTNPPENLFVGLTCCSAVALALGLLVRYEHDPEGLPPSSEYRQRWERRYGLAAGRRMVEGDAALAGAVDAGAGAVAGEAVAERRLIAEELEGCEAGVARAEQVEVGAEAAGDVPAGGTLAAPVKLGLLSAVLEPKALPGTIPMLAISPAFGFGIFFVGLVGTTMGVGSPGLFYTISAISMIAVRLGAGRFMDRTSAIRIFAVAVATGLAGYGLLLGAVGLAGTGAGAGAVGVAEGLYYAAGLPYGVSIGLAIPVNQAVAVRNSPVERWGAANALFMLASDVGIGISCLAWGLVNDAFGFSATMVCVMGCLLASLALAWACYPPADKRWRREP